MLSTAPLVKCCGFFSGDQNTLPPIEYIQQKEISPGEQAVFLEGRDERKIETIRYCGTDGNVGVRAFLIDFAPISYGILGDLLLIMLRM